MDPIVREEVYDPRDGEPVTGFTRGRSYPIRDEKKLGLVCQEIVYLVPDDTGKNQWISHWYFSPKSTPLSCADLEVEEEVPDLQEEYEFAKETGTLNSDWSWDGLEIDSKMKKMAGVDKSDFEALSELIFKSTQILGQQQDIQQEILTKLSALRDRYERKH
jgi:hypothetical protein